jgi:Cu/Ag efflux pump CusA
MSLSSSFIYRPVATTLLTLGVMLTGMVAFFLLPVASLPQVDFPTISVQASLPGASPETMAATVATPLERSLGLIAGVSEITSVSSLVQPVSPYNSILTVISTAPPGMCRRRSTQPAACCHQDCPETRLTAR